MSGTAERSKLAELRVKTDQQLAEIIDSVLELGLHFARLAEGTKSANSFDAGPPAYVSADKAWSEALTLLPKVDDLTERRRLERKLKQLREALDQAPTPGIQQWSMAANSSRC